MPSMTLSKTLRKCFLRFGRVKADHWGWSTDVWAVMPNPTRQPSPARMDAPLGAFLLSASVPTAEAGCAGPAGVNIETIVVECGGNLHLQKIVLFLNWSPCSFSPNSAWLGAFLLHQLHSKLVAFFFTKCDILGRSIGAYSRRREGWKLYFISY
jgi:hypothetical protein